MSSATRPRKTTTRKPPPPPPAAAATAGSTTNPTTTQGRNVCFIGNDMKPVISPSDGSALSAHPDPWGEEEEERKNEKYNNGKGGKKKRRRKAKPKNQIVIKDNFTVADCDLIYNSKMLRAVLDGLKIPSEEELQQQQQQPQRNQTGVPGNIVYARGFATNTTNTTTTPAAANAKPRARGRRKKFNVVRRWETIEVGGCTGRVDALLQGILSSDVEILKIDPQPTVLAKKERRAMMDAQGFAIAEKLADRYWEGLYENLPSNTSLRMLSLINWEITQWRVKGLEKAFVDYLSNTSCTLSKIRHFILTSPNFTSFGHVTLAHMLRRYYLPSLQNLSLLQTKSMSDEMIAEFLSPILTGMSLTDGVPPFRPKELCLRGNLNVSTKTMSVVGKWLRGDAVDDEGKIVTFEEQKKNEKDDDGDDDDDSTGSTDDGPPVRKQFQLYQSEDDDNQLVLGNEFYHCFSTSRLQEFHLLFHEMLAIEFGRLTGALMGRICKQNLLVLSLRKCNLSRYPYYLSSMTNFLGSIGSSSTVLQELDLFDCRLNDSNVVALSTQLHEKSKLKKLNIGGRQNFHQWRLSLSLVPGVERTVDLETLHIDVVESFTDRRRLRSHCDVNAAGRRYLFWSEKRKKEIEQWPMYNYPPSTNQKKSETKDDDGNGDGDDDDNNNNNNNDNENDKRRKDEYILALWPHVLHHAQHSVTKRNGIRSPNSVKKKGKQRADNVLSSFNMSNNNNNMNNFNNINNENEEDIDYDDTDDSTNVATDTADNSHDSIGNQSSKLVETREMRRANVLYYMLVNGAMKDCYVLYGYTNNSYSKSYFNLKKKNNNNEKDKDKKKRSSNEIEAMATTKIAAAAATATTGKRQRV